MLKFKSQHVTESYDIQLIEKNHLTNQILPVSILNLCCVFIIKQVTIAYEKITVEKERKTFFNLIFSKPF